MNITQNQLDTWVSEAEQGCDPEALKKRGRGRPGRGADPAQVVAVRLTADELRALGVMSRDVVESVEGYAANRRVVSVVVVEVEPAGQRQASFGL